MEHSILIAVDRSENAMRAVDYVGQVMSCHPEVRITLLNIIKEPSADILPEEDKRRDYVEKKQAEMSEFMEETNLRLISHGIPGKQVCLKVDVCSRPVTIADYILQEHATGEYQTIVVGRRGMSKKEEFLFGSVSSKIVREARNCTVWVVE